MDWYVQLFSLGGLLMYPLLALSLFIWFLILRRYWILRREPRDGFRLTQNFVTVFRQGNHQACEQLLAGRRNVFARILRQLLDSPTVPDRGRLEAAVLAARHELSGTPGYLRVCIGIAPLLGLLGTVTGMMTTFDVLSAIGTAEPRSLSGGISQALLTTQAGLSIAVIGIFGQAWIEKWERALLADLERVRLVLTQLTDGGAA